MGFFTGVWLGVQIWIWLYFILSLILGSGVSVYWYRERIRRKYYEIRFPEKLIKIVIHYKTRFFKEYYRLIPDDNIFVIEGKDYNFDNANILKDNDFFVTKKPKTAGSFIKVEGQEYQINDLFKIRKKRRDYPELHYFYNVPQPINFSYEDKSIKLSAKQLNQFKENDLFSKLLTLDTERNVFMILVIAMCINIIISFVIMAKMLEWIA